MLFQALARMILNERESNKKRSAHSIKGALRSMNAPEISEMVHKLEGEIIKFDDFDNFDLDSFTKDFITPYVDIKDRVKSIYVNLILTVLIQMSQQIG